MKTKNNLLILVLFLGYLMVGCDNYLDVTPKDKQTQEQLFATRSGFYAAVNGVYNKLVSNSLYGRNLSYEMIDVMALRYSPISTTGSMLSDAVTANYSGEQMKSALSSVWQTAYETILNCNVILDNIENQKTVLTENEAILLKGEMLAMRAFLHFDMLRLFGPIYKVKPQAVAIPYNESTKITNLPLLNADVVLKDYILRDIVLAEQFLGKDPVIEKGPMASAAEEGTDGDIFLRYRQLRFNFYAVKALKARVLLYAGDKENAGKVANELISDVKVKEYFPAVDPAKLLGNTQTADRVFSTEVLMGMYKNNRSDIYTYSFEGENASSFLLQTRENYLTNHLFAEETGDYRFQSQWVPATGVGATGYYFAKYKKLKFPDPDKIPFYATFMPLIRLSEMYYIAAECALELSDSYRILNEIRDLRGVPALPVVDEGNFLKSLKREYLREFYGEGQIFFMYKRLGGIIDRTENAYLDRNVAVSDARFVPSLPESEIMYR